MADYVNRYEGRVTALTNALAQLQGQPMEPTFTPEEVRRRQSENTRRELLGVLGGMSGDEAFSGVGNTVLKGAMAERAKRVSDRGEYDPITGEFRMHPEGKRVLQETLLQKQLDTAQAQEARAHDQWQRDRQRAEDQSALRQTLAALKTSNAPVGVTSIVGTVPGTGYPILMNNRTSTMSVRTPEGDIPYAGQGIQTREAYEKSQKGRMDQDTALRKANSVLQMASGTPDAFSTWKGAIERFTPEAGRGLVTGALFNDKDQTTRGIVLSEAAAAMHELIGAAQTDTERRGLIPFLVQPTDPPDIALNKLKSGAAVAQMHRMAMEGTQTGWGRGAGGGTPPPSPIPNQQVPTAMPQGVEVAPGVFVKSR